jgi:vacuolar-type H+-ATPase subunit E/Vma4
MLVKDGVTVISDEVIGASKKEAEALILKTEAYSKETMQVAKEKADQIYQETISQMNTKITIEERKIASVTEVDMRNRLLQAKEKLVDVVFENAVIKLKAFVVSEEYRVYFVKLVENAAKKLCYKTLILQINAKDHEWVTPDLLRQISVKLGLDLQLAEKVESCLGGCKIYTVDDKISFDATIDNKLQELYPLLRVKVAKKLFEAV